MKIVIIGGGTAGMAAATRLRRNDENAEILVLEKNTEFAVASCGIPLFMDGSVKDKEDLLGATTEQMKQIFNIDIRLQTEVQNIDTKRKVLILEGGALESYDKLIIANGAIQYRPDIEGSLNSNVFTVKNLEVAGRIRDFYLGSGAKKVIIIGGGDVGLAMAQAFHKLNAEVTLIEKNPQLMPDLDIEFAAIIQNQLRDAGIKLLLNRRPEKFDEKEVQLDDGQRLAFDMAIIASGVTPDVKLPILAGLKIGKDGGIKVNKQMQTSNKDIYACGDNVEIRETISDRYIRSWSAPLALKQARVVANSICGLKDKFDSATYCYGSRIFGYTAGICGLSESQLQKSDIKYRKIHLIKNNRAEYLPESSLGFFKLLFGERGEILGLEALSKDNITPMINLTTALINQRGSVEDLLHLQTAYYPTLSTPKDALNILGSLSTEILAGRLNAAFYDDIDWETAGKSFELIDVRTEKCFERSHISKAVNIPLAYLREHLNLIPENKKVILYANDSYAAYNAYCILRNRGFDNIALLSGGMLWYMEQAIDEES